MALGRVDRAEMAIEQVIRTDPAHEPGEQEPPRVRAAFATVRGRVLPEIVRATYVDAVPAYDPELLEAASRWRYAPAQRNGTPVTSTKRVDVVLRPRD